MSDNPFEDLAKEVDKARRNLEQLATDNGWKRTVIVHPQLGRNTDEAEKLANDWGAREEKQLMDNVAEVLG